MTNPATPQLAAAADPQTTQPATAGLALSRLRSRLVMTNKYIDYLINYQASASPDILDRIERMLAFGERIEDELAAITDAAPATAGRGAADGGDQ